MEEFNYLHGVPEGIYREWYENGKMKKECKYSNGRKEGVYREWYEDGEIKERCEYENGEIKDSISEVVKKLPHILQILFNII